MINKKYSMIPDSDCQEHMLSQTISLVETGMHFLLNQASGLLIIIVPIHTGNVFKN